MGKINKKTMKRKREKIEATIQIVLLITASFAFSFFINEALGSGLESVSAQEDNSQPGLTNDELTSLRGSLPNYQWTNQQLNSTLNYLQSQGCLQRSEFTNARAVSDAMQQCVDNVNNEIDSGTATTFFGAVLNGLGLMPNTQGIDGRELQRSMLDSSGGLSYCPKTKDGKICQPYATNECNDKCSSSCVNVDVTKSSLPDDTVCELGICYDSEEGICQTRSPKEECEKNDLTWYKLDDSVGTNLCARGCCIINNEAQFVTNGQCENIAKSVGYDLGTDNAQFNLGITEEPACLGEAQKLKDANLEGACVSITAYGENDCKFVTGDECSNLGGTFNSGELCSKSELNSFCTKQNSTSCIEGLDEIYWLDSCGNRENIYEGSSQAQKDLSWNNGVLKSKNDSCILFANGNPVANQGTCGNCDRFRGSICGNKTLTPIIQKLNDNQQNAVCLDTGCYDSSGKKIRENGESWCAYQGKIGLDSILPEQTGFSGLGANTFGIKLPSFINQLIGGDRAVDTVGSSHFRASCINGKIEYTACEIGRSEICVEDRSDIAESSKQFSQAACMKNTAMECFQYNPSQAEGKAIGLAGPQNAWKILKMKLELTCGLDSMCFVKDVDLTEKKDDTFKFSYCLPKYKIGFDLNNPQSGEQICQQASQSCTAVFVKGMTGEWDCKANCKCVDGSDPDSAKPSKEFITEMNNFCSSLGDCGSSVNYAGQLPGGKGYSVSVGKNPLKQLGSFADSFGFTDQFDFNSIVKRALGGDDKPNPGEYIKANNTFKFADSISSNSGVKGFIKQVDDLIDNFAGQGGSGNYGVPDTSSYGSQKSSLLSPGLVTGGAGTALLGYGYLTGGLTVPATPVISGMGTVLAGFGGALFGAGIGMATVGFLIKALGLGPGLSPGVAYTLMGAGGAGGAIVGYQAFTGGVAAIGNNPIGVIILIVVLVVLLILKLFGVGEVKEVQVNFKCSPWETPIGSSAETCRSCGQDKLSDGSDTFPCNKYACQSLGQDCVFVDGSEVPEKGGICEYSPKGDTQAPVITNLREDILSQGFEYKNANLDQRVFELRKKEGECLDQFESATFGFTTDEYATKCTISGSPQTSIDSMVQIDSGVNHTYTFNSQALEILGVTGIKEEQRNDIQLYIACQDLRGTANIGKEYTLKLCIVPRDLTPTLILDSSSLQELLAPHDAETKEIKFNINEPSECKWDTDEKLFAEMQNNANCNDFKQCTAQIPLSQDEAQVCIKCLDHPEWKGTDREGERNENSQCIKADIKKTDALEITSISPDNDTIKRGVGDTVINVQVETSGGIDGTADCYWNLDNSGEILFQETGAVTTHKQILGGGTSRLSDGEHNLKVRCVDKAENVALKETNFTLNIDSTAPKVTRVYVDSGTLYVITNEPVNCVFVNTKPANYGVCGFKVSDCDKIEGCELMSVDSSAEGYGISSTSFDASKTYYIRCADLLGNEPSQCNVKVSGGII